MSSAAQVTGPRVPEEAAHAPGASGSRFRLTPREQQRFERAIAAIDAANSTDPNWVWSHGRERPKELVHSELASEWIEVLRPYASLELRLAARAHHIRRWEIPRTSFPEGQAGYHAWRRRLQEHHAEHAGILLASECYPEDTILRVQALIRKRGLGRDPEVQVLEDALCLIFLETQLAELATRTPRTKLVEILRSTLEKMSPRAVDISSSLSLSSRERELLDEAASKQAPERAR